MTYEDVKKIRENAISLAERGQLLVLDKENLANPPHIIDDMLKGLGEEIQQVELAVRKINDNLGKKEKAFSVILSALEKQIPKKCKGFKDVCECGYGLYPHMNYCSKCGKALNWGGANGS